VIETRFQPGPEKEEKTKEACNKNRNLQFVVVARKPERNVTSRKNERSKEGEKKVQRGAFNKGGSYTSQGKILENSRNLPQLAREKKTKRRTEQGSRESNFPNRERAQL